jgi:hypothetical protein
VVGAALATMLILGCVPPQGGGEGHGYASQDGDNEPWNVASYEFYDGDTYLKPGIELGKYKRVAVLYVGKTFSSQVVQKDKGDKKEQDEGADVSQVTSVDTLLYSNALAAAFSAKGASLVERNQINALVLEQRLAANELMDLSDKEKAQRLGKLLKADLLVQGSVFIEKGGYRTPDNGNKPFFSDTTGMTVSAIDATTGEVVWLNTTIANRYVSSDDIDADPQRQLSHATMIRAMVDRVIATFYGA